MTDRVAVATTEDLAPGEGMALLVDGHGIALFNVDGAYHAIGNRCTHAGGSLGNGTLTADTVTCPLHGARFDVTSGEVLGGPAHESVDRYAVEVAGGVVYLRI